MSCCQLSPELWEMILGYVDLDGLKALRLTNKQLSSLCSGPRFTHAIEEQTLHWPKLHTMHKLKKLPNLARLVKRVHLVANVYDTYNLYQRHRDIEQRLDGNDYDDSECGGFSDEDEDEFDHEDEDDNASEGEDRSTRFDLEGEMDEIEMEDAIMREKQSTNDMLTDKVALADMKATFRLLGKLDHFCLTAKIFHSEDEEAAPMALCRWDKVWQRTSRYYYLAMSALLKSGIPVKSLSIYDHHLSACVVPHVALLPFRKYDSTVLGKSLESLILRTSAREDDIARSVSKPFSKGLEERDASFGLPPSQIVPQLLEYTPNLKALGLYVVDPWARIYSDTDVFGQMTRGVHLPLLETCMLENILTSEKSLLKFLESHSQIKSLSLKYLTLSSESWDRIMAHLENKMPNLVRLSLDSIRNDNRTIFSVKPVWENDEGSKSDHSSQFSTTVELNDYGNVTYCRREFDENDLKKGLKFKQFDNLTDITTPSV